MKEIKAPNKIVGNNLLFLSGSISERWQDKVVRLLKDTNWTILNPRRDDWDSSWVQSIDNAKFKEQVEWELEGMEKARDILMYFDPSTQSPITLLELGLFARSKKLVVVCPEGFWRKGNVDVVCRAYGILHFKTIEDALGMYL